MTIELISNCMHFSEHATYLATDGSGKRKIIKTATSQNGIGNLHNEARGWSWYQKLRYPAENEPICRIAQERHKYLQIQIMYIDGYKPVFQKGLERNADTIRTIVQHYCDIWPRSAEPSPMHGDLSLGNIIINSDGVHIIDWEHFKAGAAPWGFDLIYLLFETLYFGIQPCFEPTAGEIQVIREQLNTIKACHMLPVDLVREPLRFLKEFVIKNNHLWGEQFIKFPVLVFTSDQITLIDEMIRSGAV